MNIFKVVNELYGEVGWKSTNGFSLDSTVTGTRSSLLFNKKHPLVSLQNIEAIMPEHEYIDWPGHSSSESYSVGDVVTNNDKLYECVQEIVFDGSGASQPPPITEENYWRLYSPLSAYIKDITTRGIEAVVIDWLSVNSEEKMLHSGRLLGEYSDDLYPNNGLICGLRIITKRSRSLVINTRKIILQFEEAQDIEVKLYKLGYTNPIHTETFSYTDAGDPQEFEFEFELKDGNYFLTYDQRLVNGGYINIDKNVTNKYFVKHGFTCQDTFKTDVNTSTSNYGLDLDLDVSCDFTDFVIEQRSKFRTLIIKRVVIEFLREFISNPSALVNRFESNMDDKQIQYEIDGSTEVKSVKLDEEYRKLLTSTKVNFTKLDRICHKCRKKGARYKTV